MASVPRYPEVLAEPGSRVLMLGNVAIARGFLEAGVQFVAAYPGTPSTEIVEALAYASRIIGSGPYVEWSVNEKVAVEAALGAAMAGARSVAAMKHVGLNVAADPFFSSAYLGVEGALVVVSADDPWMWSSQNEQDNRWYGLHAYVPVVEPLGAQEAREAARLALEYSGRFKRPFLYRSTTRIAHTRVPVEPRPLPGRDEFRLRGSFRKDPSRWTLIPAYARRRRLELLDSWERLRRLLGGFPLNRAYDRGGSVALVGVGLGYRYLLEAARVVGVADSVSLYAISTSVPLPEDVASRLLTYDRVLVVEEGDPVVEFQLRSYASERGVALGITGKMGAEPLLPRHGELGLEKVVYAVSRVLGVEPPEWVKAALDPPRPPAGIPERPPVLCAGCPYRSFFYALRRAVNKLRLRPVYSGDIGCYSLGILPPFSMQDTIIDMGASISAGAGLAHALGGGDGGIVVAIIGDSTFFHSGLTGLANAVYNKSPLLVIVLDNHTTAMTGHQPHPGIGVGARGEPAPRILVEEAARGLGVEKILVADAFNIRDSEQKLVEALSYVTTQGKPALVVARGSCILVALQEARRRGVKPPVYRVEADKCTGCGICYTVFNCPAISKAGDGKAVVDPALCTGCGECSQVCPFDAFKPVAEPPSEWHAIMRTARPRAA